MQPQGHDGGGRGGERIEDEGSRFRGLGVLGVVGALGALGFQGF